MLSYTCVPVGMLQSNCYVLKDEATGALALVDCGICNKLVREEIADKGGDLRYILLTHGHFDHIQGVPKAKELYSQSLVCISAEDAPYLRNEQDILPGRKMQQQALEPDRLLADGETIMLGESCLEVIATPGHTLGGLCFLNRQAELLLTGDTLFFEEVGRDDLPGGSWETLKASILRLYALEGNCEVLPGHGQPSTLAHERANNPYVRL